MQQNQTEWEQLAHTLSQRTRNHSILHKAEEQEEKRKINKETQPFTDSWGARAHEEEEEEERKEKSTSTPILSRF